MLKRWILCLACLMLLGCSAAAEGETSIILGDTITVDGQAIGAEPAAVYLCRQTETHGDVPAELSGLVNRVVTITAPGTYRICGTGEDVQLAVRAGAEDDVRLILDGADITCRTAPALVVYSARDPRTAGAYAVTLEIASGSVNRIAGSHTVRIQDTDTKLDGAVCSLVSLGVEGEGTLTIDADNEGLEVKFGHLTINGGVLDIQSGDDPLNVSEDGVGVLTMNGGYVFSAVKAAAGGEGDGIDSNGWIVFNGGTAINLAHPTSQDSGIDADMGSTINGGVIVGAGNMYDPIDAASGQLFMMLEFAESTDDLLVVTDSAGKPVFAYDFPHDYMYIAFSSPDLRAGESYRVYLGGEITGTAHNGLYTAIDAYVPGRLMQHGAGNARQRGGGFDPMAGMEPPQGDLPAMNLPAGLDLNVILAGADLNEVLSGVDLNRLLTGVPITELLTEEQLQQYLGDADPAMPEGASRGGRGFGGGFGGPRGMSSSADTATTAFVLTPETTGFTNVTAAE